MSHAQPIFIVGMNGSGTTLLLDCLDSHPLLYGFPRETKIFPYLLQFALKQDLRDDVAFLRLWERARRASEIVHANHGAPVPLPKDWSYYPRDAGTVIDAIFLHFARAKGKDRWCEKTPMHGLHISLLSTVFPAARFIHIIRDGRACAASFFRRWGYLPEHTIYRWKGVLRETRRQGQKVAPRYLEVSYERLIRHPTGVLREICAFLDIPFDEAVLAPSRTRRLTTGSHEARIGPPKSDWRRCFSSEQRIALEYLAGAALVEYGYQPEFIAGDARPSWMVRKAWLYRDYLRRGFIEALRTAASDSPHAWRRYFRYIADAIRQRMTTNL